MISFRHLTILISSLIAIPTLGTAQDVERNVDQIFAAYDKPESPGCALGVVRAGQFIYKKGYGMASIELRVPITSQSVFYMGSVSKQFTAASVVFAAEQGFLSLDDNVRKYIPELPDYGHPITVRQMLHHMSGFSDVGGMLLISGRNIEDLHPTAELIDLVARQKALNFKPGEEYMYSNTNYFLLAEVVKRATQKPFSEFATENIFKPLGMTHTRFYDDHTMVVPGRAAGYRPGKNNDFLLDWSTNYDMVGAGGLMSSVDDLLLWDKNFYDNRLGRGTLLKEMQTIGVLNNGNPTTYGLGLFLSTYRGLSIVEHDGALLGFRTEILRFPQQRFSVLMLCNVSTADPMRLARKVADLYLEKELQPPPVSIATFNSDPSSFAGKYFDRQRHFLVSFTVADGSLVLQGEALLRAEANRFESTVTGGDVTFFKASGGLSATVVYNGTTTFQGTQISDFHPDANLDAYTGIYKNAELDSRYTLSVKDGSLMLERNWNQPMKLQPVIQDEFNVGEELTFVFRRDAAKRVLGIDVFAGWNDVIRDVRYEKMN
jgi:CubicO group peptidase (beta-lactamase class C family)